MDALQIQAKLSRKQESSLCLDCGECCKRYWITVLPEEAKKISRLQKIQVKEFLQNSCTLNVKLFVKTTPGGLTYPATFFPKRIYEILKKELGNVPQSFFVVPQVTLIREEKNVFKFTKNKSFKEKRSTCVFLLADNKSEIYDLRPEPCKLFPFIAMPDFREQYPFCALYKETSKDFSIESRIYFKKIQQYFKNIDDNGFVGVWRSPPEKGLLFLGEKQIGEISLNELVQMMPQKN